MKIETNILQILDTARVEGNDIKLICGQLDRKEYLAVNKVLEAMGGKWNRKVGRHIFSDDPTDKLEQIILTGEIDRPQDIGYFPTPPVIIHRMIELAAIHPTMTVLEPSAGQGHIADELRSRGIQLLMVCELKSENLVILKDKGYLVVAEDFLQYNGKFDRIVMNPPFARQADIDHVSHAYNLLNPGGRLVSVMSSGITFRQNKKVVNFRKFLEDRGWFEELPPNSFKSSGTSVNAIIVVLDWLEEECLS